MKEQIKKLEEENKEIIENLKYMHIAIRPKAMSIIGKNLAEIEILKKEI